MLLFGGVVISQSRFVTDSRLIPIFENMRFNNYYLPGIVIGLAITMIVTGCLNGVSSGLGCSILCFKSNAKTKVLLTWQVLMIILLIIGLCFWIHLLCVVHEGMFYQLYWEFLVYGGGTYIQKYYTRAWNALFVTYSCCSVGDITNFGHTEYTLTGYSQQFIPTYCRSGATIANSDLDAITVPPTKSSDVTYYSTMCDTALKEEIKDYAIYFGVISFIALIIKGVNMLLLRKFKFGSDSADDEASTWETIKEFIR
ncbi:uncharacterized protein LOC117340314 [Pecten maximus]|uniref:uncharacterized protein LOC117340314 n=1 Tax=Pecten maximus TaxID=6579 RepID=UPI001457EB58|nr:uncharacterized protein LOC117340314 [Pecten maximus]